MKAGESVETLSGSVLGGRLGNWTLGFVVWTLVGLSFASRSAITAYQTGSSIGWHVLFSQYLIDFYVIGLASPVIFWLCRRYPIERGRMIARFFAHLVFSILFTTVVYPMCLVAIWYIGYPDLSQTPTLWDWLRDSFLLPHFIHQVLISYWATLGVAHAFEYSRRVQREKTQTAELASQLAQAQLAALKMQIHPHFLFNTLNSITALLHKDPDAAEQMIARLSEFLRMTLKGSNASAVTLEEEIRFLKNYLEIEKIRFRDRLLIDIRVDPAVLEARVPNLILQPIVENAFRHGLSKQCDRGKLTIDAKGYSDRLVIEIADNGPGIALQNGGSSERKEGVGLSNTRARLKEFFDGDFQFEIGNLPGSKGTMVRLVVPCTN
ncbi:MAG: sensor histidine kinase [Pyrinomonadaceae bacterium]